jgi:hypothetical protein
MRNRKQQMTGATKTPTRRERALRLLTAAQIEIPDKRKEICSPGADLIRTHCLI